VEGPSPKFTRGGQKKNYGRSVKPKRKGPRSLGKKKRHPQIVEEIKKMKLKKKSGVNPQKLWKKVNWTPQNHPRKRRGPLISQPFLRIITPYWKEESKILTLSKNNLKGSPFFKNRTLRNKFGEKKKSALEYPK